MLTQGELAAAIRELVPINRLPQAALQRIAALGEALDFVGGQLIYGQGQYDDFVYYLLEGELELSWNGADVRRLAAGAKAARRPLDTPGRKKFTVRAVGPARLARFPRVRLDEITAESTQAAATKELEVSEIASERSSDWMTRMLQSALFAALPATNLQRVFSRMESVEVSADQVIVRQGEPGDYYYVVEQGYCEVSREIAGGRREIHLADLGPGQAFGEAALISGKPRDATVTMLSDGRLMRLSGSDFNDLIRLPLLQGIAGDEAQAAVANGACWLDIRYPEDYARVTLRNSRNLPLNVLRIQYQRLPRDAHYLVCSEDPEQSAVGAFLLIERGLNVKYLTQALSKLLEDYPNMILNDDMGAGGDNRVVQFPGTTASGASPMSELREEAMPMEQQHSAHFESTIDRIDRLYSTREYEDAMRQRVPVEAYADTSTGRALADIIDDIEERHDAIPPATTDGGSSTILDGSSTEFIDFGQLEAAATAAAVSAATTATVLPQIMSIDTRQPMPASRLLGEEPVAAARELDEIGEIVGDFEQRLRGYLDSAVLERGMDIERRYQDKLQRVRQNAAAELRKRETVLREGLESAYQKKELALRAHYKKLMALANKISQQKAHLQQARKQFEEKLVAVNALHRQVEEMRRQLREHLGPLGAPGDLAQRGQGY